MNFLKKFYNDYINIKLSDYDGFESNLEINKLLFFVFLGIAVACMVITYHNSTATLILKKLTRVGAFGEEKSKTLSDIGLGDSRAVKRLLTNRSGALKNVIALRGDKKLTFEEYSELEKEKKLLKGLSKEEKKKKLSEINEKLSPTINFSEALFYIPEDMKDTSERFISDKSTTLMKGILSCSILIAAYLVIVLVSPSLLSWISNIISD